MICPKKQKSALFGLVVEWALFTLNVFFQRFFSNKNPWEVFWAEGGNLPLEFAVFFVKMMERRSTSFLKSIWHSPYILACIHPFLTNLPFWYLCHAFWLQDTSGQSLFFVFGIVIILGGAGVVHQQCLICFPFKWWRWIKGFASFKRTLWSTENVPSESHGDLMMDGGAPIGWQDIHLQALKPTKMFSSKSLRSRRF